MSQQGVASFDSSMTIIQTLTGNSGGAVSPDGAGNIDVLGNNSSGIDIVGTPASSLLTVVGLAASTTQVGTVELATAVETGTLTDSTRAVTPAGLEPILVTPYVVDSGGAYTTIQSALDAANAAGGGMVWVRPGSYTENLTFYDNIQLSSPSEQSVTIIGTHTPPSSGTLNIDRVTFSSATDIFNSAAAGTTAIIMEDCSVVVTNGYTFNLPNFTASASVAVFNIGNFGTNDGFFYNTGGCQFYVFAAGFGNGTMNACNITGVTVLSQATVVGCPVTFSTGAAGLATGCQFTQAVTLAGNSAIDFSNCYFSSTAAAITMSSTVANSISQSTIDSSNNPALAGAGAGTLTLNDISFLDNANIAATLTLGSSSIYPVDLANGELLIGSTGQAAVASTLTAGTNISISNAAGSITINANGGGALAITSLTTADTPYVVLDSDEYLSCDVSGGVLQINMPNAPSTGRIITVKDMGGDASSFNITVTTVGGVVTIDGSTTYVMNTDYQAARFIFNGTSYEVF